MKTLLLTQKDIKKIFKMRNAISVVERTFRSFASGKTQMPEKSYVYLPKFRGDFRSMPAFVEDQHAVGVKWVNVHLNNFKKSLPTVMAMIVLGDVKTGYPIAVMDGTYLTNLRTGAAGAVAAKHLARKNSHTIALIGSGNQARTQLEGLNLLFKIRHVKVWSTDSSADEKLIKETAYRFPFTVEKSKSAEMCVKNADIVVTTTPSREPIIKLKWIAPGTHINAIGADAKGKEELEPAILTHSKLVVDDWVQASHGGEINVPVSKGIITKRDIYAELGSIIAGKRKGRANNSEITVFDSTGLSIHDIACAHAVYKQAVKRRIGDFKTFF